MADIDDSTLAQQQPSSSRFLEILCTSSGKIRRFSPDTDAEFALQLINKKLQSSGEPLALYIEAVKEGEEPISFGLKTQLIDYGDGWGLRTVTTTDHPPQDEASQDKNALQDPTMDPLPDFMELARDYVQSSRNHELHLINSPVQEVNKPITSEPVSDIESQSSAKWDFTDMFTTDKVFSSRDELINWAKNIGRAVASVVIIMGSHPKHIFFGCERGGKWRERGRRSDKTRESFGKSRKCECPFRLRGRKIGKDDKWKVKVLRGHHNHPVEKQHGSYCGKLTAEEKELVIKIWKVGGYKGKEILQVLKDRDPLTEASLKKIYNTITLVHQKEKKRFVISSI